MVPRNEVTKGVSNYVRKYELSDPTNKQKFIFGNSPEGVVLKTLLGNPSEEVTYVNLQRYLKQHYIITEASAKASGTKTVDVVQPVVTESVVADAPKKKTVLVKKKKESTSQLAEDA